MDGWTTFAWLLIALPILVWTEGQIHRRMQETIVLATGHPDFALMVYTLILLPGVFLHEFGHYLMATVLGVRASKFSLWPTRQRNGMLRLGYVETVRVDPLREALIGAAPIVFGSLVVVLIGTQVFNVGPLGDALAAGKVAQVLAALDSVTQTRDPWLWLYLVFAVSNAMLPSASDRQAWPVVLVVVLLLAAAVYLLGLGPSVAVRVAEPVTYAVRLLATAFTITIAIDLPLLVILFVLRGLAGWATGRRLAE